jgi:hypothetical protein
METYRIKLPLSSCSGDLDKVQSILEKYSGRKVVDNQNTKLQILRKLHIGIVSSFRIGWCPLVIHFSGESRDYITKTFAEMSITFNKDSILCEARVATDKEYEKEQVLVENATLNVKYEYIFN